MGDTKVHVTASIEDRVPRWLMNGNHGWITAEYGMLPRATSERTSREAARGHQSGRTLEIQRLIGRCLRASCELELLGQRTITLDCDVIQADGGTRTASVTGAYVALLQACKHLERRQLVKRNPVTTQVAAVSVGIVAGEIMVDLCYSEDSRAGVDLNLVSTADGRLVEVQATAENGTYSPKQLEEMVTLGRQGIELLMRKQQEALMKIGS